MVVGTEARSTRAAMALGAAWLLLCAPAPNAISQGPHRQIQPSALAPSATLALGLPSISAADDLGTIPAQSGAVARVRWTLPESVAFALAHNPRLRAAAAEVDRSLAEEQIAFAPFLPQIDLLNRLAGTDSNLSPGAPGLTGSILSQGQGGHAFVQSELQVQWTLYDFGRTAGRYGRSAAQAQIARLRLSRAREPSFTMTQPTGGFSAVMPRAR